MEYSIYCNDKLQCDKNTISECFHEIEEWCKNHGYYFDIFEVNKYKEFGKDTIIIKPNKLCIYYRNIIFKIKVKLQLP